MYHVTSQDGTKIAYDVSGEGRPLILIDGALTSRSFGPMPRLAQLLAPDFATINYDRRGRGDSADTRPYAVDREVEDLEALIDAAGGSAFVFGISSGGALALEGAIELSDKIIGLAIYEAPYKSGDAARLEWRDYTHQLAQLLAADRRGDAVALFMRLVGTPDVQIDGMRQAPIWAALEAVAPTLAYDAATLGEDRSVPSTRVGRITAPTTVMNGSASDPFMRDTAQALAKAVPLAQYRELEGETHAVREETLAPVLAEVLPGGSQRRRRESGGQDQSAA